MTRELRPMRRREVLHRSLYTIVLPGPGGARSEYVVEIDAGRDEGTVALYADGRRRAQGDPPASFPVPGGVIEVDLSLAGVSRVHLVRADGREQRLAPVAGTLEHRRGQLQRRHPGLSRALGRAAIAVLVVNLLLAVPQALEFVTTRSDRIAELFGVFTSPVHLPVWLTVTLAVAGVLAAVERALTWRHNRVLDIDTTWLSG